MNSKKSLKNTSFILFLGLALIFFGLLANSLSLVPRISLISQLSTSGVDQPQKSPSSVPNVLVEAKVIKVIDGDTIVIDTGEYIRYIGMNTPEVETNECFASEASEINKNLVLGKTVKLEKDISDKDKYGRLLRFIYIDDTFVDDYLVKNGAAKIMTVPPDVKYKDEFLSSQTYAKENKLGLWGKCPS